MGMGGPQLAAALLTGIVALAVLAGCNTEGEILYAQRLAWQDPNNVLQSWDPARGANPCDWYHVDCEHGKHVTSIYLGNGAISGPLIPQLGGLKNLQYLYLYQNELNGSIPTTFGNLTNLVNLDLQHNLLTGSIPASLGAISTLQNLRLDGNKLTGAIPPSLGNLTNLVNLELQMNALTGSIPASLGNIKTLQILRLSENMLNDTVPPEILALATVGNLSELPDKCGLINFLGSSLETGASTGNRVRLPAHLLTCSKPQTQVTVVESLVAGSQQGWMPESEW
ncbi:hypothetical protein ACP70R_002689 [Stipagrostis hirtigluma subsp. patula]